MEFVHHPSNNMLLGAPPSMPDCATLPATATIDGEAMIITSFWRPSPEELAALNNGGFAMLSVYGQHHPPVSLAVSEPV